MGGGTEEPVPEHDPFDVPQRREVRSPRSRGAGNSGEEEEQFEENVKEAHDIIAQLETLVNKMETKRHTKRRTARASRSRDSTPADSKAHINANRGSSSEGKGKERQGKPYAVSPSALLGGGSRGTTTTITTQTSGPKLISLPPGGADKPIELNGMRYNPDRKVWEGGKELSPDDDGAFESDDESQGASNSGNKSNLSIDAHHRQPLRKSSPHKAARALREEDYVLDDTGEWIKRDLVEPTEKEKSQPRLFLIRYLNPTNPVAASKMAGDMRLVDGRWVKASEEENDDMDAFGDDEELQKWGETDTYFAELPKEFDLGEDTLNQWRRRQEEHQKEMGCWTAPEKDPKRFLLDGLRQMYIIRVVDQANTKGRAWRKANSSPAKFPAPVTVASAVRVAARQNSGIPTKLDKFKDDSDRFDQDLEFDDGKQLSPRRREARTDDSEEDGFGEVSPPASDSDREDWGDDFDSPLANKKLGAPAMAASRSFEGIEIGDDDDEDDDDDVMEMDDDAGVDARQANQPQLEGADDDEDWGDDKVTSRLPGVMSIGDDDDEGDDEFEELNTHNNSSSKQKVGANADDDDDDEDWGMDDVDDDDGGDNGKAPALNKPRQVNQVVKKLLGGMVMTDDAEEEDDDDDLVISDGEDDAAVARNGQSRPLSRHLSEPFTNDHEVEDDLMMHNVGGIINSDARRFLNRK
ncbi:uncharacterized protein ACA1_224390 [Acanthamoeba castellanii str. Neff]|uniref:Uncharacterized protein n=1 Tax=Acanthamoeba castellanii (strain ATCC 30010 / Neff) TaxID=1257118 RepID=L8GST9_ACACF|nr:uncharacterized protein ACA1_224390 [Acanthamoeba castellanii str. Neff]ELR16060.1 hypothetical protein ACA1_224390 [Acanthamoeba castellanii str. Neff]